MQGTELQAQIRQMCPALSLQQIYKLTEHHHDDWISGGHSSDTLALLATLKRFADAGYRRVQPALERCFALLCKTLA